MTVVAYAQVYGWAEKRGKRFPGLPNLLVSRLGRYHVPHIASSKTDTGRSSMSKVRNAMICTNLGTDCCVDWESDVTLNDGDIRSSGWYPGRQEDNMERRHQHGYCSIGCPRSPSRPSSCRRLQLTFSPILSPVFTKLDRNEGRLTLISRLSRL